MGNLKERLKQTPVHTAYWKVIDFWPIRKTRSFLKGKRRDHLLDAAFPAYYDAKKTKPVNERKVIFLEYRSETLSDNFRLLWDTLEREYDFILKFHNLGHLFLKQKEYEARCIALLEDLADAKYVFVNDANEVLSCLALRPETVVTQTWHACAAFKKWGMSTADKIFGANRENLERHPNYANLSYVTVSAPEVIWAYAEAMNLKGKEEIIRPVGVSRTDNYFDPSRTETARRKLVSLFPEAEGKKVILYAPTFRGRVAHAKGPDEMDLPAFAQALSEEYVLVIKHHPYVKELPPVPDAASSFARDVSRDMEIEELLLVSDVCISDYSSLIFEYSLLQRPMLFFAYDLEEYDDWRGFYYPYEKMTPGPVVKSSRELLETILDLPNWWETRKAEVDAFRETFMSACDGHATDRTLALTMGEETLNRFRKV